MKLTKKELLKSPARRWDDTSRWYNSILIVPAGTKHDSGFMHIAIIGVYVENGEERYEICGHPDDISCDFPMLSLPSGNIFQLVRMDCYYPQGVLHYHGNGRFKVSAALSSMDIHFEPHKK